MALKDIKAANNAKTELAQAISPTDNSFIVNDASVFPDAPFRITIDKEIMEVGKINKSTNTFSDITRGVEGTTATNHDKGASVENRWTAGTLQILLDNIKTTFTRVVEGKRQLAAALDDMNQSVDYDADFAQLAAKIRDISKDATATPGYVARGKTFYADGRKQTGTYYLDAKPWRLITPTTSRINVSGGYYPDGITVEGDSNLRSSNILRGKSIFGVRGTAQIEKYTTSFYAGSSEFKRVYTPFKPLAVDVYWRDDEEYDYEWWVEFLNGNSYNYKYRNKPTGLYVELQNDSVDVKWTWTGNIHVVVYGAKNMIYDV